MPQAEHIGVIKMARQKRPTIFKNIKTDKRREIHKNLTQQIPNNNINLYNISKQNIIHVSRQAFTMSMPTMILQV